MDDRPHSPRHRVKEEYYEGGDRREYDDRRANDDRRGNHDDRDRRDYDDRQGYQRQYDQNRRQGDGNYRDYPHEQDQQRRRSPSPILPAKKRRLDKYDDENPVPRLDPDRHRGGDPENPDQSLNYAIFVGNLCPKVRNPAQLTRFLERSMSSVYSQRIHVVQVDFHNPPTNPRSFQNNDGDYAEQDMFSARVDLENAAQAKECLALHGIRFYQIPLVVRPWAGQTQKKMPSRSSPSRSPSPARSGRSSQTPPALPTPGPSSFRQQNPKKRPYDESSPGDPRRNSDTLRSGERGRDEDEMNNRYGNPRHQDQHDRPDGGDFRRRSSYGNEDSDFDRDYYGDDRRDGRDDPRRQQQLNRRDEGFRDGRSRSPSPGSVLGSPGTSRHSQQQPPPSQQQNASRSKLNMDYGLFISNFPPMTTCRSLHEFLIARSKLMFGIALRIKHLNIRDAPFGGNNDKNSNSSNNDNSDGKKGGYGYLELESQRDVWHALVLLEKDYYKNCKIYTKTWDRRFPPPRGDDQFDYYGDGNRSRDDDFGADKDEYGNRRRVVLNEAAYRSVHILGIPRDISEQYLSNFLHDRFITRAFKDLNLKGFRAPECSIFQSSSGNIKEDGSSHARRPSSSSPPQFLEARVEFQGEAEAWYALSLDGNYFPHRRSDLLTIKPWDPLIPPGYENKYKPSFSDQGPSARRHENDNDPRRPNDGYDDGRGGRRDSMNNDERYMRDERDGPRVGGRDEGGGKPPNARVDPKEIISIQNRSIVVLNLPPTTTKETLCQSLCDRLRQTSSNGREDYCPRILQCVLMRRGNLHYAFAEFEREIFSKDAQQLKHFSYTPPSHGREGEKNEFGDKNRNFYGNDGSMNGADGKKLVFFNLIIRGWGRTPPPGYRYGLTNSFVAESRRERDRDMNDDKRRAPPSPQRQERPEPDRPRYDNDDVSIGSASSYDKYRRAERDGQGQPTPRRDSSAARDVPRSEEGSRMKYDDDAPPHAAKSQDLVMSSFPMVAKDDSEELKMLKEELAMSQETLKERMNAEQDLRNEMTKMRIEMKGLQTNLQQSMKELNKARLQVEEMEKLQEELDECKATLQEKTDSERRLQKEVCDLQNEVEQLAQESEERDKETAEKGSELLKKTIKENEQLKKDLSSANEQLVAQQKELKTLKEEGSEENKDEDE